ncbi:hypothetical protein ACH5RR_031512 [Cinchona calisaya]|uniref:Uncharacterized protein n=1 Tax=Cinchona calisaya TaxID=153742 RepID=A0ABD2YIX5_9GENT
MEEIKLQLIEYEKARKALAVMEKLTKELLGTIPTENILKLDKEVDVLQAFYTITFFGQSLTCSVGDPLMVGGWFRNKFRTHIEEAGIYNVSSSTGNKFEVVKIGNLVAVDAPADLVAVDSPADLVAVAHKERDPVTKEEAVNDGIHCVIKEEPGEATPPALAPSTIPLPSLVSSAIPPPVSAPFAIQSNIEVVTIKPSGSIHTRFAYDQAINRDPAAHIRELVTIRDTGGKHTRFIYEEDAADVAED